MEPPATASRLLACLPPLAPSAAGPPPPPQEFWGLLLSANRTGSGIPQKFLDEKAEEIRKRKEEEERIQVCQGSTAGGNGRVGAGWSR